jgi:phage regulator Rha-like protein
MKELMNNNEVTMTSLEVVELVNKLRKEEGNEKVKRHSDFLASIEKEIEGLQNVGIPTERNFSLCEYQAEEGGRKYKCYKMNKFGIMQMLNKESAYVRYKTQEYINALEKQLREVNIQPKFELPQNYLEALKVLVQSEEEKIVLIEENNQLKDEVEDLKEYKLFKSMINNRTEDSMLLGQFGQLLKSNCPNLKTGRNLIFKYCKENNLVKVEYKENYATFYAVNNGWLMNVSDIVDGRGGTTLCNKIYITNKGCLYLGKKLFEDYLKSNI